jgi:hypothetical protein
MIAPTDERSIRAIAIYREALSIRNAPYEFLGYMKIINILFKQGNQQIGWINATLPLLTEKHARSRIDELKVTEADVGKYLYESGRCAVAHAFDVPVVNPDDPIDIFRLSADMPVARALAEYLIEHELVLQRYVESQQQRTTSVSLMPFRRSFWRVCLVWLLREARLRCWL